MFRPNPGRKSRVPGIRRYWEFDYKKVVKEDEIQYSVVYTDDGEEEERRLLRNYLCEFKDMPPLNASVPRTNDKRPC
jgi:hypothetical protein